MATHFSALAWRIPGTEEPGGLPYMGSHRVGHDWRDLAAAAGDQVNSNLWIGLRAFIFPDIPGILNTHRLLSPLYIHSPFPPWQVVISLLSWTYLHTLLIFSRYWAEEMCLLLLWAIFNSLIPYMELFFSSLQFGEEALLHLWTVPLCSFPFFRASLLCFFSFSSLVSHFPSGPSTQYISRNYLCLST